MLALSAIDVSLHYYMLNFHRKKKSVENHTKSHVGDDEESITEFYVNNIDSKIDAEHKCIREGFLGENPIFHQFAKFFSG